MTVALRALGGADLAAALDDLADLRIRVFADWPYLYAGDRAYEADYLREFAASPGAVLVAAHDGARIVGAATAAPMIHQKREFSDPFASAGIAIDRLFYFGESVLLPDYRGQGIGHGFFDHREAAARAWNADCACFAAVVRPPDHPARPDAYVPLDGFWRKRGYAPVPGLITMLGWKDHGEADETMKPMQYWMRRW